MKLIPRNGYVIFRRIQVGHTPSGILTPDASIEGVTHVVEAVGPDVKDLKVGDKILVIGVHKQDYGELPNLKNLFLTPQANVALVYGDDE